MAASLANGCQKNLPPLMLVSKRSLMARPITISTEHIVETARQLFLSQGVAVSTARIADELGISEGLIFKRFKTKDALFVAAMGLPATDFASLWPERAGQTSVETELVAISQRLVAHFRVALPRMIMGRRISAVDPLSEMSRSESPAPVVVLDGVTEYLRREIMLGRFEAQEPRVVARMLVGALANFVFFEVMGFEEHDDEETRRTIRGMVSLLTAGSRLS